MSFTLRTTIALLLTVTSLAVLSSPSRADYVATVTIDTAGLSPDANYTIAFQFTLGGSTQNTATVSEFMGYASLGTDPSSQNTTGTFPTSTSIELSPPPTSYAYYQQDVTPVVDPGGQLQFNVDVTNLPQSNGMSDTFTVTLFTMGGDETIASGNIDTTNGSFTSMGPVTISPGVSAVPEPASFSLLLLGGTISGAVGIWRRRVGGNLNSHQAAATLPLA